MEKTAQNKIPTHVMQLIGMSHTIIRHTKLEKLKKGLKFDISWLCSQFFNYREKNDFAEFSHAQ